MKTMTSELNRCNGTVRKTKLYDLNKDDYVAEYRCDGKLFLELRAEDQNEPDTRDGRGTRLVIRENTEINVDVLLEFIRNNKEWLASGNLKAESNA